jgi:membrane protein
MAEEDEKSLDICLVKPTVLSFIADDALGKGAAIASYTVTPIAPVLLIVIAVAGLVFGREAAQNGIVGQLPGLGKESAQLLQSAVAGAQNKSSGTLATLIGIVTVIITASGVFGQMQSALNAIWKTASSGTPVSRLIRTRAASLGLVVLLEFLMMVSLVVSTGLTALGDYLNAVLPSGKALLTILNGIVSFLLILLLFAAIYNVLPDRPIQWRDVVIGSAVTSLLFTDGNSLIDWYIGSSAVASTYGAAGALIVILLWVYYSAQIFPLGAEFTKPYSDFHSGKSPEQKASQQMD